MELVFRSKKRFAKLVSFLLTIVFAVGPTTLIYSVDVDDASATSLPGTGGQVLDLAASSLDAAQQLNNTVIYKPGSNQVLEGAYSQDFLVENAGNNKVLQNEINTISNLNNEIEQGQSDAQTLRFQIGELTSRISTLNEELENNNLSDADRVEISGQVFEAYSQRSNLQEDLANTEQRVEDLQIQQIEIDAAGGTDAVIDNLNDLFSNRSVSPTYRAGSSQVLEDPSFGIGYSYQTLNNEIAGNNDRIDLEQAKIRELISSGQVRENIGEQAIADLENMRSTSLGNAGDLAAGSAQAALYLLGSVENFAQLQEVIDDLLDGALQATGNCILENLFVTIFRYIVLFIASWIADISKDNIKSILSVPSWDGIREESDRLKKGKDTAVEFNGFPILPSMNAFHWCIQDYFINTIANSAKKFMTEGFGGNPYFVDDYEDFYGTIRVNAWMDVIAANDGHGHPIEETRLAVFNTGTRLAQSRSDYIYDSCPIDESVMVQYESGVPIPEIDGWESWMLVEIGSNLSCSGPGNLILLQEEMARKAADDDSNASRQIGDNAGYLPSQEDGETKTPGNEIRNSAQQRYIQNVNERLAQIDDIDQLGIFLFKTMLQPEIDEHLWEQNSG